MSRNLRTEGFMKGLKIINSCYKSEHFKVAHNYISNFRKLFGDETFGGEYTRLLLVQLRDRKKLNENFE